MFRQHDSGSRGAREQSGRTFQESETILGPTGTAPECVYPRAAETATTHLHTNMLIVVLRRDRRVFNSNK